jgi:transposase InsO family protein
MSSPSGSKATSEKVTRWRLFIQGYDFVIEHIPGPQNVVPDLFSRLVPRAAALSVQGPSVLVDVPRGVSAVTAGVAASVAACRVVEIPKESRGIISSFHDELVGHFGVERTVQMLRAAGHSWKGMTRQVRAFVSQCPLCQKLSFVRPSNIADPITTAGDFKPMDRWCIDTLDIVETEDGYKCVLACMDSFTRWIELFALKSVEAEEAAVCLINLFGRFGAPRELLSDRGSQFVNKLIDALLKAMGSSHKLSLAYSKEENGMIERANREILRHLRAFIMHSKVVDDWVSKLPFVQRIMNASVHSLTGFSPAAMLYGKAIDLNRSIFPVVASSGGTAERGQARRRGPVVGLDVSQAFFASWVDTRNAMQQAVLSASEDLQSTALQAHLSSVDPASVTTFALNSWVLVLPRSNSLTGRRAAGDKLASFWEGPMRVTGVQGNTYTLHDTVQDKAVDRHVSELKIFLYDPEYTDPAQIAQIDRREFAIEAILDHRGNTSQKSSLEFLVRWAGYSDEYDLWLPWKEVMYTEQIRTYLAAKGLSKLLPKAAR